jgi:hypothetical protein
VHMYRGYRLLVCSKVDNRSYKWQLKELSSPNINKVIIAKVCNEIIAKHDQVLYSQNTNKLSIWNE